MTNRRPQIVVEPQPLLVYLLDALKLKRGQAKNLLKHGAVAVNRTPVRQFDHPLAAGDEVEVRSVRSVAVSERMQKARIYVVHEDEDLFVVEKPSGLLMVATDRQATDTLYVRVNEFLREREPRPARAWVVHRIDRETSGLALFAKSEAVKQRLQETWSAVEKTYLAVVQSSPPAPAGTISSYLIEDPQSLKVFSRDSPTADSRRAVTHYRSLETRFERTLVEVRLETGRKHQIRVHLASVGCPVVGDRRYGPRSSFASRLALHASGLTLAHPTTGQPLRLNSQLPKELRRLLS